MLSAPAPGQAPGGWPADALRGGAASGSPEQLPAGRGLAGMPGTSPPGQDIPSAVGSAPDTASTASQQTSLFPRFSPDAADLFGGGAAAQQQHAAAAAAHQHQAHQQQHAQQAALKQNLQKLYGSLGLQHGSRSSLPDIQEHEPQMCLPSDPPLASRLPPFGRPPAGRALSDEDLFGMQDLGQGAAAAAATAGGAPAGATLGAAPPGGAPPAADLSMVGQLPAGGSQSRTLFVRNVDPSVPEEELRTLFEAFGEVRSLYTAAKARGFVVVSYHDTRAATLAKHTLTGQALGSQQLDVHFSLPKDDREAAQGTLLVASLDGATSRQDILFLFSQYGELREVRDDPLRPNCCLVEFYDTRHAASALQGIGQSAEMSSRLVVMEAGAAALSQVTAPPPAPPQAPPMNTSLSHDYLSSLSAAGGGGGGGIQYGGGPAGPAPGMGMRNVGSSPALLYGSTHGSSNQLDYLLGGGGPAVAAAAGLQMQQQQGGGGGGGFDPASQLLSSLSASADPLGGMNRSFSEMSLDSSGAVAGMGARFGTASMSTGDLLAMTQGLHGGGAGPAGGMRGIASTGSMWPHQHHASLGSSPVGAPGMWPPGLVGGSHGNLQELLQRQQAVNAALSMQQQAAVNAALMQQPNSLVQNAALQAAMQQALLQQQAAALLGHGGLGAAGLLGAGGRRGAEVPLGGRLARRPMDPVAEAERRMQQDKLYSLDVNKIRLGEDKRTTLMVKNIPNKYTQKMLLALVEERFRGMIDFFYLPIDFKNKCNVGYAFINMVRPEYIVPLVEELHGKKWPKFNSEKICHIAYGRIQGKAVLVQHFQNSSLLHEDKRCRPILFHSNGALAGEVEPFPGTLPSPIVPPGAGLAAPGSSVPLMAAAAASAASAAVPAAAAAPAAPPAAAVPAAAEPGHAA
ncbi:MEI2-like 5 isoform X1 [Micractinium conductrix]|uniref:MEI2-like 5 isoform X1 n=1 Tax=Micractinium conductrix TaxID=554055 RepID=A0A2P6VHG5_9CHLO|nr:MEI2-like 5 isoform X1 [Micractinium conductrix]|eukprot:PSC73518.1 MEI2-like 5 isoform X1 [Micractinium conductrix]